jgi:hypothetical protein
MSDENPTPEPATPVEQPAAEPATAQRVEDLPDWAQKQIADARREAAASRVNAKQAAADEAKNELAQQIGKALGLVKDEPIDPAALTAQVEQARADAQAARLENAIYRAALTAGVDANALTDSRAFMQAAAAIDPTDTAALAAAIATATTHNPTLVRQAPQAAASGGADMTGGTGGQRNYTEQQLGDPAFFQANKADIFAWLRAGGNG